MPKLNCWEYMKCGREPGGATATQHGICPVAAGNSFDGFNQGINAGRICWLVAGTFCGGRVQGSFAEKRSSCKSCEFYRLVNAEEGATNALYDDISIFALTGVGLVRKTNEDRYFIKKLPDSSILLAVADGLGGEVAGDYAAELLRGRLGGVQNISAGKEEQQLAQLVVDIDQTIMNESDKDTDLDGMGTTLVCVLIRNNMAYWVHVGDSRLYHLHLTELSQITRDHNFARYLVEQGDITPEEAMTHKARFHLDQCIGQGFCQPDTGQFQTAPQDMLLLATDGLHTKMGPDTIKNILIATTTLEVKAKELYQAALDSGGDDNITLIVVRL